MELKNLLNGIKNSIRKITKDLEIHEKILYGWLNDYREKHSLEVLNPKSKKSVSIEIIKDYAKKQHLN